MSSLEKAREKELKKIKAYFRLDTVIEFHKSDKKSIRLIEDDGSQYYKLVVQAILLNGFEIDDPIPESQIYNFTETVLTLQGSTKIIRFNKQ